MSDRLFIKICGMRDCEDAKFAIDAGVDAIGFIAFPKSPRYIDPRQVKEVCSSLHSDRRRVQKTGVFVNAELDVVKEYVSAGIDTVQLHGSESAQFAEECAGLAENLEVWKVIKPQSTEDVAKLADFPADKFLLDTFHKTLQGGTGEVMDLELAKFAVKTLQKPVIIAGGLSPANISDIVRDVEPYGIDVNSGVESAPGKKDHLLIEQLFRNLSSII